MSAEPNITIITAFSIINARSFQIIDTHIHSAVPNTPTARSYVLNSGPANLNITDTIINNVAAHLTYQSSGYVPFLLSSRVVII